MKTKDLLEDFLGAVNQPVVDNIVDSITLAIMDARDGKNFTIAQAKKIVAYIVKTTPKKEIEKAERERDR